MNLLKTAFDIDGVVCHTWKIIIEVLGELGWPVTEDDMVSFRLEDCLNIPYDVIRTAIVKSLSKEYMHRKPIDTEAVCCIRDIYEKTGKTIPFITSRKSPEDTEYYLENYIVRGQFPYIVRHGSFDDGLKCWDRKCIQIQELGCIAMVEDAPENLLALSKYRIIPLLRDRPYNKYCNWALRFTSWKPVYDLILSLEGVVCWQ